MKVYLKAYLRNNLGDDLFVKTICERYPQTKFHIITAQSNETFSALNNIYIHKPNVICRVLGRIFGINIQERIIRKKTDMMVYVGGSIFMESNKKKLVQNISIYSNRKPYYIMGFNIGPYSSKEYIELINEKIFKDASFMSVRDRESFALIDKKDNAICAPDIMFIAASEATIEEKEQYAVVSVIDLTRKANKDDAEKYERYLYSLCCHLRDKGIEPVLVSFCSYEGDEEAISRIVAKDERLRKYYYRGNISEATKLLRGAKLVFGSRFHASVLALCHGIPLVPFAYSDKTKNMLKLIGFKGRVLDIDSISKKEITSIIEHALRNKREYDLRGIKMNAEEHFKALDEVLR